MKKSSSKNISLPKFIKIGITTVCFFMISNALSAQFAVNYRYHFNNYDTWNSLFTEDKAFPSDHEIGLSYYYKFPNHRVELHPEVSFGMPQSSNLFVKGWEGSDISQSFITVGLPIHVYLFDLEDDCDCPTFSKTGPSFIKNISAFIAPRLRYNLRKINNTKTNKAVFSLGLGLAYDIGVSDLITITPTLGAYYNFNDEVKLHDLNESLLPKDSFTSLALGIRVLTRFDYVRKNRW